MSGSSLVLAHICLVIMCEFQAKGPRPKYEIDIEGSYAPALRTTKEAVSMFHFVCASDLRHEYSCSPKNL